MFFRAPMAADAAELEASTCGMFNGPPVGLVEMAARATVANQTDRFATDDRFRWHGCLFRCKTGRSCSVVVANTIFLKNIYTRYVILLPLLGLFRRSLCLIPSRSARWNSDGLPVNFSNHKYTSNQVPKYSSARRGRTGDQDLCRVSKKM